MGKPVWGHGRAEVLELDRWGMRQLQQQLGIPAPDTVLIRGIEALRDHCRETEDRWIKSSCFRGDGETWHHECWPISEVYLDYLANRLGALAHDYEWISEENLEGVEVAYDGYEVHGRFPGNTYFGFEVKDKGYLGKFVDYMDLHPTIRDANDKLAPILAENHSTGFCAFEIRLGKDGVGRVIDPCLRNGSPCTEVQIEALDNLSEILWAGAHGDLVEPQPAGHYIAEAMIHCLFALTNWVPLDFPKDLLRWVKLRNKAIIGDKVYHVPTAGEMPEIGAVVAVADTAQEAIRLVRERAAQVKGYLVEIQDDALDKAQDEIKEAKRYGVKF